MPEPASPAPAAAKSFLDFIRAAAGELRTGDRPPKSLEEWNDWRGVLRNKLRAAWGPVPTDPGSLDPQMLGRLERDGYRVEKIVFQTRPRVWMTANAYVPAKEGKLPAVLCVHGHWKGAKQDPHVQARCIGLAKLGFFVLAVDALGAGERGVGTALGEYHGEMTAATLFPIGLPLSGWQVQENMRAVDYLLSRSEVDPARIGITGASGGGNQSMYAGAWDERFKAVVPVCSVGNYQAYLGAACCMCEVVPGALQFTEEWGVLSLVAPRALLVISATQDAHQFSIMEAQKSLARAAPVFELYGKAAHLRHATFESPHDYNKAMRETMYGFMTQHLKGEGDGSPIAEAEQKLEELEDLRCYPGDSRPADYLTIPRLAALEAAKILEKKPVPDHRAFWESEEFQMREGLRRVLGTDPPECPLSLQVTELDEGKRQLQFDSEPGIRLTATHLPADSKRWLVLVDPLGREQAIGGEYAKALVAAGWNVVAVELRACGSLSVPGDAIGRAPDHNSAEWSMWIGRPLLGQWSYDVRRTPDAILASIEGVPEEIAIVGVGQGGPIAILAAAQDEVFSRVGTSDALATYLSTGPYQNQRLGLMAPGILRQVGDLPHLAAMIAPRRLLVAGPIDGDGQAIPPQRHDQLFDYPRRMFALDRKRDLLTVTATLAPSEFAKKFSEI